MLSHYDVLGVDSAADLDAIRHAWRVKIRLLHPDKHRGAPEDVLAEAEKETLQVNRAWETLGNAARRQRYDGHLARPRERNDQGGTSHEQSRPPGHADAPELRVTVTCSVCKTKQRVERTAGRFNCVNCKMAWEFAKCGGCNSILQVAGRRRTWRCASCGRQQLSSWAGGPRDVVCVRCKSPTVAAPGLHRFNCTRCKLDHFRCRGCGAYSALEAPPSRHWRCVECSRINAKSVHTSLDLVQQLSFLFSAACCLTLGVVLLARMIQ